MARKKVLIVSRYVLTSTPHPPQLSSLSLDVHEIEKSEDETAGNDRGEDEVITVFVPLDAVNHPANGWEASSEATQPAADPLENGPSAQEGFTCGVRGVDRGGDGGERGLQAGLLGEKEFLVGPRGAAEGDMKKNSRECKTRKERMSVESTMRREQQQRMRRADNNGVQRRQALPARVAASK